MRSISHFMWPLDNKLPDAVQLIPRKSMLRWVLVGFVVITTLAGGFFVYAGVASLQAEERLQATLFATRLVYIYVKDHDHWPTSWHDLETVHVHADLTTSTYGREPTYHWPRDSQHLQQYVVIEFGANCDELARPER